MMNRRAISLVRAAIAFHLSLFAFQLQAASTSLTSPTNYYFTVPGTTNIFGRVIGDGGDYKLVRQEDIAWLREAFAERNALAAWSGVTRDTNTVVGALVKGQSFDGPDDGVWYDPDVEGVETNVPSGYNVYRAFASSGITNITISTTNLPSRGLVSLGRITNLYHTARLARRLVYFDTPTLQPDLLVRTERISEGISEVYDLDEDSHADDYSFTPVPFRNAEVTTNSSTAFYEASSFDGKSVSVSVGAPEPPPGIEPPRDERWKYTLSASGEWSGHNVSEPVGDGNVQLTITQPCDTNVWLRGSGSPERFVRDIAAWGLVHVYTNNCPADDSAVLLLGRPNFAYATNNALVWRLDVSRRGVAERAANMVGTVGPSWGTSAIVAPPPAPINPWANQMIEFRDDFGVIVADLVQQVSAATNASHQFYASMTEVQLVIDIEPNTVLGGW